MALDALCGVKWCVCDDESLRFAWCRVALCRVAWCRVAWCRVASRDVASLHVASLRVASRRFASRRFASQHVAASRIVSRDVAARRDMTRNNVAASRRTSRLVATLSSSKKMKNDVDDDWLSNTFDVTAPRRSAQRHSALRIAAPPPTPCRNLPFRGITPATRVNDAKTISVSAVVRLSQRRRIRDFFRRNAT